MDASLLLPTYSSPRQRQRPRPGAAPAIRVYSSSSNKKKGEGSLYCVFSVAAAAANMSNSGGGDSASNIYSAYAITTRLNPSMAIIIVVLLSAFFFMGFFSLYVRRCAEANAADAADGAPTPGRGNRRGIRAGTRRGLDPAVIARFPIERFSLKKAAQQMQCTGTCTDCVVCLAEFQDEEHVRVLPACGHLFHVSCIDAWLSSHTTCPLCRRSLWLSLPLPRPVPVPVPAVSSPAAEASVAVVVDRWAGRTNAGPAQRGAVSALNSPVSGAGESFRRSFSTGHSLLASCEWGRGGVLPAMMASEKAGHHRSSSAGAGDTDEDYRRRLWVYPSSAEENASASASAMGLGIPRSAHSWFRPR